MPFLPCFALLWAKGLEALSQRWRVRALGGLVALLFAANAFSVYNIVTYLNVVYGG